MIHGLVGFKALTRREDGTYGSPESSLKSYLEGLYDTPEELHNLITWNQYGQLDAVCNHHPPCDPLPGERHGCGIWASICPDYVRNSYARISAPVFLMEGCGHQAMHWSNIRNYAGFRAEQGQLLAVVNAFRKYEVLVGQKDKLSKSNIEALRAAEYFQLDFISLEGALDLIYDQWVAVHQTPWPPCVPVPSKLAAAQ